MPGSDSMPVPDFDTIRAGDNILASPDFASPLTENTPNLSDASPFTSSFSSTHHQTSPPLIDYSDTTLDLVPLFNQSSVVADTHKFNELYFSHSPSMNDGSPPGAGMDIPPLFSSQPSPLFFPEGTFPFWRTTRAGRRSISEPPQSASSRPDTGGTLGQSNSPTDAPTQRQKHPGRFALISRKTPSAGPEARREKIAAKRRRGVETVEEEGAVDAAVENKCRVVALQSRQPKNLDEQLSEIAAPTPDAFGSDLIQNYVNMIRQPNQTDIVASNDANPVIADQEPKPAIHGVDSMSGFYNVSASSELTSPEANALEYWCNTHRPTNRSAVLVVEYQNRQLASEILSHLVDHGCEDVTNKLDLNQCGTHPIAGGGFGDIYKGVLVGGAAIAIKCPRVFLKNDQESNEMLKNVAREIYASSKLKHPNVLELIGLSTFRGYISIVSPWMENGTLLEYVGKNPEVDRFQLCVQIVAGLVHIHEAGNVHGDVKSPNVLISEAGIAKLTDFGNIRLKKYTLEFSGTITGSKISLRWAAPELLKEESASTKEADVYALGMTFLETVTGKIPFSGKTEFTVLAAILQGKTPERPQELDTWIGGRKADLLWVAMSQCWNHQAPGRPSAMKVKNSLESPELI